MEIKGSVCEFDSGPVSLGFYYRNLIAIDNNPQNIYCLRQRGIKGILGTIDTLPIQDNSFDYVIAFSPLIVRGNKGIKTVSGKTEITSEYKCEIVKRAIEIARKKVLIASVPIAVDPPQMLKIEKIVLTPYYYVIYKA